MNPKGVLTINPSDQRNILCCPAELRDKNELGIVQVWDLDNIGDECLTVHAHASTLSILELNYDGSLLATASEKGTLIRIFDTEKGTMVQELRRGSEKVVIFSVSFHFQDEWLSCISDSGTLHIFNILAKERVGERERRGQTMSKNRKSMFNFMKFVNSYFGSEYSFAHFKNKFDTLTKIFFLPNFEVLLVSYDGHCSRLKFDKKNGGQCEELSTSNFISRSKGGISGLMSASKG